MPDSYVQALCSELSFRLKKSDLQKLKTIYIGGGTPSLLTAEQLFKIVNTVRTFRDFGSLLEFTIEVNPDDINKDLLKSYKDIGITRISCGIQSLNEESLKFVGRRASLEQNLNAVKLLSDFWEGDLSLDLICALPDETQLTFLDGLKQILKYKPDHISLYSLTLEEETPLGKLVYSNKVNYDSDFQEELWLNSKEFLTQNGYSHYEVSNFSLPGKECIHNLVYWNHEDYIGVGSGACGTLYNSDGSAVRWTNIDDVNKYIDYWNGNLKSVCPSFDETIDVQTSMFEYFMMGFRKLSGINSKDFINKFNLEIPAEVLKVILEWNKKGLLDICSQGDSTTYNLNSKGILFLNKFLEEII